MKLSYTERALAGVDLAVEWYESQQPGLGREFLDSLGESILKIIAAKAFSYQVVKGFSKSPPLVNFL